jgi:hypothetical protein
MKEKAQALLDAAKSIDSDMILEGMISGAQFHVNGGIVRIGNGGLSISDPTGFNRGRKVVTIEFE